MNDIEWKEDKDYCYELVLIIDDWEMFCLDSFCLEHARR